MGLQTVRTRDAPGSRAPKGGSDAATSPRAEALDVVPGLPLDYAQVDRGTDEQLEGYRRSTLRVRDIMIGRQYDRETFNWDWTWFDERVEDGCLSTLQSMDRTGRLRMNAWSEGDFHRVIQNVTYHGNVEMLDWFFSRAQEVHGETQDEGTRGFRLSKDVLKFAFEGGSLGVIKWLHANGCPHDVDFFKLAVWHERVEIMRWLHADGCPMDHKATAYAAMEGKIEYIKWLRERGCEWNASACALAAGSGDHETLKYLRANGCPWNLATLLFAQRQCCFWMISKPKPPPRHRSLGDWNHVVGWAASNGLPNCSFYDGAREEGGRPICTGFGKFGKKHPAFEEWTAGGVADLFDHKPAGKWQNRDRDIDKLIAFAAREDLDFDPRS